MARHELGTPAIAPNPATRVTASREPGLRILLTNDDHHLLESLRRLVEDHGDRVSPWPVGPKQPYVPAVLVQIDALT